MEPDQNNPGVVGEFKRSSFLVVKDVSQLTSTTIAASGGVARLPRNPDQAFRIEDVALKCPEGR